MCNILDPLCFNTVHVPISRNLYCVMSFVSQRHLSQIGLTLASRSTLPDSMCRSCTYLHQLRADIDKYIIPLSESGYAEGQMCHVLMRGTETEKKNVAVRPPVKSAPNRFLFASIDTMQKMITSA